jgi:hypothetical protein
MSARKPCINVQTTTYSGKEQSPLRFGLSAEGYDINTIMQGYDKMDWMVKTKNNKKVWVRQMPSLIKKLYHEEPVVVEEKNEVVSENKIVINVCTEPVEEKSSDNNVIDDNPVQQPEQPEQPEQPKPEIIKPNVQEKKVTDYNLFLTHRLIELKRDNKSKANKEHFAAAIAEWKELKNKPDDLKEILSRIKNQI